MRKLLLILVTAFLTSSLFAQTIQDGLTMLNNENYKGAQAIFDKIITATPQNGEAYYYLGQTFLALDNATAAKATFNKGLEANKNAAILHIGLGRLLLDEGKPAEAEKLFSQALRMTKSKDPKMYARIADAYLDSKKPNAAKAVENARIARDLNPQDVPTLVLLGDANLKNGNSGEAMTSYENAAKKDPKNTDVVLKMAKIWSGPQPKLAIEQLENLIKMDQSNAMVYRFLGDMYQRDKQYDKVPAMLDKYLSLAGNDTDARFNLVRYLSTFPAENADRIISESDRVLKDDPSFFRIYRFRSWALSEKGEYQKSIDAMLAFDKGPKTIVDTLYTNDYNYAARNLVGLGQFDQAKTALLKIVEKDPTRTDVYGTIAKMYFDAKDLPKAIEAYEMKIAKSTEVDAADYNQIGYCQYFLKDWAKSEAAYAKVCELSPKYTYAWNQRANCLANLDDVDNPKFIAEPVYQKLMEIIEPDATLNKDPRNIGYLANAYNYMGYKLVAANDLPGALAWFQKTLAIDAANANATEVVAQIQAALGGK